MSRGATFQVNTVYINKEAAIIANPATTEKPNLTLTAAPVKEGKSTGTVALAEGQ
jgi:hypothetical protein